MGRSMLVIKRKSDDSVEDMLDFDTLEEAEEEKKVIDSFLDYASYYMVIEPIKKEKQGEF